MLFGHFNIIYIYYGLLGNWFCDMLFSALVFVTSMFLFCFLHLILQSVHRYNPSWLHSYHLLNIAYLNLVQRVPGSIPGRAQIFVFVVAPLCYWMWLVKQMQWMTKTLQSGLICVMPDCFYTHLLCLFILQDNIGLCLAVWPIWY